MAVSCFTKTKCQQSFGTSVSGAISDLTSSPHPISFCPRRCRLAFFLHSMFKLNLSILNHFISIFQAFIRMRMQFEIFLSMSTFLFNHLKFIYSEKATKFCEIFTLLLTTVYTAYKLYIQQSYIHQVL